MEYRIAGDFGGTKIWQIDSKLMFGEKNFGE